MCVCGGGGVRACVLPAPTCVFLDLGQTIIDCTQTIFAGNLKTRKIHKLVKSEETIVLHDPEQE